MDRSLTLPLRNSMIELNSVSVGCVKAYQMIDEDVNFFVGYIDTCESSLIDITAKFRKRLLLTSFQEPSEPEMEFEGVVYKTQTMGDAFCDMMKVESNGESSITLHDAHKEIMLAAGLCDDIELPAWFASFFEKGGEFKCILLQNDTDEGVFELMISNEKSFLYHYFWE